MPIDRELMRGAGPGAVLQLLSRREMYGYELIEALAEETGGVLAMGQSTLYPLLYNLEAKKLIRGHWKRAASGRRRKYYALTAAGEKILRRHQAEWSNVFGALRGIGLIDSTSGGAS